MIHPSAHIDPSAILGSNVEVGPNCVVGRDAVLGDGCMLYNNVTIGPRTRCGARNEFFPGAVIGMPPQDLKYKGGDTRVESGDDNVFREYVTVHAGTEVAGGITRIGSHNRFLVGVHIAHDCEIGNGCILSNQVQLAGHVKLEDKVTMGGVSAVHHFTTLGTLSYVGGLCRIVADVPPYMVVEGNPSSVRGFNRIGLRRWGFTDEQIEGIREAYSVLFSSRRERDAGPILVRIKELEGLPALGAEARNLCAFVRRALDGVYGRQMENKRRDTDADRKDFYGHDGKSRGNP